MSLQYAEIIMQYLNSLSIEELVKHANTYERARKVAQHAITHYFKKK